MPDITMCKGEDCPVKHKCYRNTAKSCEYQSWFGEQVYVIKEGVFTCEMYWGDNAESIWSQLKDITK